jgi:hypothetical protein
MTDKPKFVKITYEVPVAPNIASSAFETQFETLSQEELDRGFDLVVRLKSDMIFIDKYFVEYSRKNPNTGAVLPPSGQWKTIFMIPKDRVIYIKTTNVEIYE